MVGMTAFLGYIAITPNPTVVNPQLNYPFLALMLGLTALLAVAMAIRPVRMTREELRLAVLAPIVPGLGLAAVGLYGLFAGTPPAAEQTSSPTRLIVFGVLLIVVGAACLLRRLACWPPRLRADGKTLCG